MTISWVEDAVRTALARYWPEEARAYEVISSEGVDLLGKPTALRAVGRECRFHGGELLDELVLLVGQRRLHHRDLVAEVVDLARVAVDPLAERSTGIRLGSDERREAVGPAAEQLLHGVRVARDRVLEGRRVEREVAGQGGGRHGARTGRRPGADADVEHRTERAAAHPGDRRVHRRAHLREQGLQILVVVQRAGLGPV